MGGVGRSAVMVVGKVNRCERGATVTITTSKSRRGVPSPVWSNACSSRRPSSGATGVGTGEVRAEQRRAEQGRAMGGRGGRGGRAKREVGAELGSCAWADWQIGQLPDLGPWGPVPG